MQRFQRLGKRQDDRIHNVNKFSTKSYLESMETKLVCFAGVFLALFTFVSSGGVSFYGGAQPPKDVLSRIEETRRSMNCQAHILTTAVYRSATDITITVSLRGLPGYVNSTFILDELYINIHNGGQAVQTVSNEELWVSEAQTETPLARVSLSSNENGYRAIKMRRIFASWMKSQRNMGILKIKVSSTRMATSIENSKSYFVVYAHSMTSLPHFVRCESYDVVIRSQSLGNEQFSTKICSPPSDVTFPFNASKLFDMGAALRKSLQDSPIPKSSAVLTNPKCCYATEAASRLFAGFGPKNISFQKVELKNIEIKKCGCGVI